MPKYKAPKARSSMPAPRNAVPCLILLVLGITSILVLLYLSLKSS